MEDGVSNSYSITPSTKLVNPGLGNKQSSHYLEMARNFIEANPETPVGMEGPADTR